MNPNQQGSQGLTQYANVTICDFSKMQTTGTATIRPIKDNLKKETKISIKCYVGNDPFDLDESGTPKVVTFGIPIGTYPNNTPKFRLLTIRNQRNFNLSYRPDAMEYHVWRNSEEVKGSANCGAMPRYEIFDPEADNKRIYGKAIQKAQAVTLISLLTEPEARDIARIFGIDPMSASMDVIRGRMVIAAEKNPENVLNIFANKVQTEVMKTYKKAEAFGLITFEPMKGYLWKGAHPLGSTEAQAMGTLSQDTAMYAAIVLEANQMEKAELAKRTKPSGVANLFKESVQNREGNMNFTASQPVRTEVNPGAAQLPHEAGNLAPTGAEEILNEDNF